jgi:hypothetical protein
MPSHRIHLKGPWTFCWKEAGNQDVPPLTAGTVTMPQDWSTLFGHCSGTVEFARRFHRPTNLEPHESVMLVLSEVRGTGAIRLNNQPVGEFTAYGDSIEFEITTLMNSFNELIIKIMFAPKAEPERTGGLSGAVALEIRS